MPHVTYRSPGQYLAPLRDAVACDVQSAPTPSRSVVLQVLKALADPSHPDLAAHLRTAAASISLKKRHELPIWLEGGLLTRLLDILRALPTLNLSPPLAAEVCSAAAAAVCNILQLTEVSRLPLGNFTHQGLMEAAQCPDMLSGLLQCGILNPAAGEQLPPGHEYYSMQWDHSGQLVRMSTTSSTGTFDKLLATPATICILLAVDVTAHIATVRDGLALPPGYKDVLVKLLDTTVLTRILSMANLMPKLSACTPTTHRLHALICLCAFCGRIQQMYRNATITSTYFSGNTFGRQFRIHSQAQFFDALFKTAAPPRVP